MTACAISWLRALMRVRISMPSSARVSGPAARQAGMAAVASLISASTGLCG